MQHPDDGLIEEYLDGELASPERAELEAHLAGCPACRERLETSRQFLAEASHLIEDLGDPGAIPPPAAVPVAVPAARPRRFPTRQLAWAATLVIAAGVGYASGTWRAQYRLTPQLEEKAESPGIDQPSSPPAVQPSSAPSEEPAATRESERSPRQPSSRPTIQPSEDAAAAAGVGRRADALRDEDVARRQENQPSSRPAVQPPEFAKSAANAAPPAVQPSSRPAVSLDDAVRLLGGSIRLIDGMEVEQVAIENQGVVVLTYRDAAGNPIELRQSRPQALQRQSLAAAAEEAQKIGADSRARAANPAPAPAPAAGALDALAMKQKDKEEDGGLGWTDSAGFRLLLRADADADSLRKIRTRIR